MLEFLPWKLTTSWISPTLYTIYALGGLIALIFVIRLVMFRLSFKMKVRVRKITGSRKVIKDDIGKIVKEDGVEMLRLYFHKELTKIPPEDCIDVDEKGRQCTEAYRFGPGDFVFITDDTNIEDIKNKLDRANKANKSGSIDPFHPFTTTERTLLIKQTEKAIKRKGTGLMDILQKFAIPIMLFMMFILFLIYFDDIAKPVQQMADTLNGFADKLNHFVDKIDASTQRLDQMYKEQSTLPSPDPTPPPG